MKLDLVIDWFENQTIDRGLNLGKNIFFPKIKSKGYMGYVNDFDGILHFKPSNLEKRIGALPNEISVTGKKIKNKINKFCKGLKISLSPAFRHQYLFNSTNFRQFKFYQFLPNSGIILPNLILHNFQETDYVDFP